MLFSTEDLRKDVLEIRAQLRAGTLSNAVARTLLVGAKIALDTLRVEMDAARLGCEFGAIDLSTISRAKLKRVA
jgi:hypothetical protein